MNPSLTNLKNLPASLMSKQIKISTIGHNEAELNLITNAGKFENHQLIKKGFVSFWITDYDFRQQP